MSKQNQTIWKDIAGYEGLYKVSNTGKVWGLKTNTILSPGIRPDKPYRIVSLSKKGDKKTHNIHRLVAETFLSDQRSSSKTLVLHKDDEKSNNHVSNLYWGDHADNGRDRRRNNKRRKRQQQRGNT